MENVYDDEKTAKELELLHDYEKFISKNATKAAKLNSKIVEAMVEAGITELDLGNGETVYLEVIPTDEVLEQAENKE